jgi:hypothetical protein
MVYDVDAGREVADLVGRIWHWLVLLLYLVELRWSEPVMWRWGET